MFGKYRTRTYIWPVAFFAIVILAVTVFLAGCKKQNTERYNRTQPEADCLFADPGPGVFYIRIRHECPSIFKLLGQSHFFSELTL